MKFHKKIEMKVYIDTSITLLILGLLLMYHGSTGHGESVLFIGQTMAIFGGASLVIDVIVFLRRNS